MKTKILTTIFLFLAIGVATVSAQHIERKKQLDQTFTLTGKQIIELDIAYTDLRVVAGAQSNEVRVQVEVVTRAETEVLAQEMLEAVVVNPRKVSNGLRLTTDIKGNRSGAANAQIRCLLTIPKDCDPRIIAHYSDIVFEAPVANELTIYLEYSNLRLDSHCNSAQIGASYSDVYAKSIDELLLGMNYGEIVVEKVQWLSVNEANYSEMRIDELHRGTTSDVSVINAKYSDIMIGVMPSVKRMGVSAQYSDIVCEFKGFTPSLKGRLQMQYSDLLWEYFKPEPKLGIGTELEKPGDFGGPNLFRGMYQSETGARDFEFDITLRYAELEMRVK